MKRTTYIFILLTALTVVIFVALFFRVYCRTTTEAASTAPTFHIQLLNMETDDDYSISTSHSSVWRMSVNDSIVNEPSFFVSANAFPGEVFSLSLTVNHKYRSYTLVNDSQPIVIDAVGPTLLEGSENNHRLWDFCTKLDSLKEQMEEIRDDNNNKETDEYQIENYRFLADWYDSLHHTAGQLVLDVLQHAKDTALTDLAIDKFHYLEKDEQAIRAIDSTDSRYLPRQKTALHYKLEKARKKFTGSPLADAEAYNLKGEKVKLSQWIGKGYYTLLYVEGWYHQTAGLEKYLIKKAYQKYQHPAKQLELITCHSFNRYEDWLEKIKEDELPGIQLNEPERFTINANYSNAVGGSNLMLFDPDGRVVRSNIRPDQLDQLLFILLGE